MSVLDFETNFETVAKEFLETDLSSFSSLQFASSLDRNEFTVPRIEINAQVQEAQDPPTQDFLDRFNYSQYLLNLSIKIITDMSSDIADEATGLDPSNFHRQVREKIRTSMLLSSDNWTTSSFNSAIVRGAGSSIVNGTYSYTGVAGHAGRYTFEKPAGASYGKIKYTDSNEWEICVEQDGEDVVFYTGTPSGFHPWNVSSWATVAANASSPAPTVSQGYILEDYAVKYMRPTTTDYEIDSDFGISTLNYEIKFEILPSRWES